MDPEATSAKATDLGPCAVTSGDRDRDRDDSAACIAAITAAIAMLPSGTPIAQRVKADLHDEVDRIGRNYGRIVGEAERHRLIDAGKPAAAHPDYRPFWER